MWHPTTETPREGADIVALNEHHIEMGFYRRGDLHICGGASRIAIPFVTFTHWAYAPGEVAE